MVMGLIALGVGTFTITHQFFNAKPHFGFFMIGGWFILGAIFFIWSGFQRKYPELQIDDDSIWVRGSKFERRYISQARVAGITYPSGYGNYLILHFHQMPKLSFGWRIYKIFERLEHSMMMSPKFDNSGKELPKEPRLIIGLNWLDSDIELVNEQLRQSEQTP